MYIYTHTHTPNGTSVRLRVIHEHGGHRQENTLDSSTRVVWQSHQQNGLVAKEEELGEGNDEFGLKMYLCPFFEGIMNMP
jgi:hypothetical protein